MSAARQTSDQEMAAPAGATRFEALAISVIATTQVAQKIAAASEARRQSKALLRRIRKTSRKVAKGRNSSITVHAGETLACFYFADVYACGSYLQDLGDGGQRITFARIRETAPESRRYKIGCYRIGRVGKMLAVRGEERGGSGNKNGRDACACRPEFVCEVVNPANRDHAYLEGLDVRGLQALGTLGDFEFNRLAIIQRLVAISHDCGEMDENVLSTLALDESKALAGIEPLHCTLFFTHCFYSFLLTAMRSYFESGRVGTVLVMSYLVPRLRTPQQSYGPSLGVKKGRKCDLATDLTLPKAIQEQQTRNQSSTVYRVLPETFLTRLLDQRTPARKDIVRQQGLELTADPGGHRALSIDGPGEHRAAVKV